MTKKFETQKARFIEIANDLHETDKYVISILHPQEDGKTACTIAVNASAKELFAAVGEIAKSILKNDQAPADQCLALARDFNRHITEACAEASAEMLAAKNPADAISELQALLNLIGKGDDEDESDADSDHADE